MRLTPRRRRRSDFICGVEIRISTPDGVVVEADSEHLHYAARYAGYGDDPPGDGWLSLIAGNGDGTGLGDPSPAEEFSTVPLKIEIRAAQLKPIDRR